ncbi:MAG TPA: hypothetical protein VF637_12990 [Sphingomicrobium sp.]
MMAVAARALMSLATCCLGEDRRDWALAMQGEFEAAVHKRESLAFAAGCLFAAWREMPKQEEGRFVLANYTLALGVLIPMAVLQLACAIGSPNVFTGQSGSYQMLSDGGGKGPFLMDAQLSAAPALLVIWLLLGIGHLRLAWVLVERNWAGVTKVAATIAATAVALFIFSEVLFFDVASLLPQAAMLGIELALVFVVARWEASIFPDGPAAASTT